MMSRNRQPERVTRRAAGMSRLACICALGAWSALAAAQTASPESGKASALGLTVSEITSESELVRVAVNKAVLLRFSDPIDEPRVVNSDIAEITPVSPYQLVLTGKSFGTTQLIVRSNGDGQKVFDVAVDLELDRLAASIRGAVPRAAVKVQGLLNAVVLTGTAPDAESAERIVEIASLFSDRVVNHLQVAGTQQVLLRCTVAEVNRRATRQLGFNGWIAGDNAPDVFGLSNIGGINPSNIGAAGGSIVSPPVALGNSVQAPAGGIVPFVVDSGGIPVTAATTLSLGFPRVPMQIFVQALRENGLLRVLAEPNLVALSGREASFLAGGSFPIPVPQGQDTISIEFREFGVQLKFTPTVLADDRVRLHVAPEISEPDYSSAVQVQGFFVPGLTQRRVETMVEVGSGQTIAIGGLLSEKSRATAKRVPGLGDVPVLGALFSSVEYQSEETELVILITPELVSGIAPQQVTHVPGANYRAPNDFELFLLGQLDGTGDGRPRLTPEANRVPPASAPTDYGHETVMRLRGPVGPAGSAEGL